MIKMESWVLLLLEALKENIQNSIYSKSEIDKFLKDLDIDVENISKEDIAKLKDIQIFKSEKEKYFIINNIKISSKIDEQGKEHLYINDIDIAEPKIEAMTDEEVNKFIETNINN